MVPGKQPTAQEIEDAAVLATMEGGLIGGLNCETAEKALQGMSKVQLDNFVDSTQRRATERR